MYVCDLCHQRWLLAYAIDEADELIYFSEECGCRKVGTISKPFAKIDDDLLTAEDIRAYCNSTRGDFAGQSARSQATDHQASLFEGTA